MDINASIIDQRLMGMLDDLREPASTQLGIRDDGRLKSLAFVYLCVRTMLDLDVEAAFDCLTEGGGDFGVDAMHITEEMDGEFAVTLIQGKYRDNLDARNNFPEGDVRKLINAVRHLFDPSAQLQAINPRLRALVEQARSLIRDGFIPQVRAIACNNGLVWSAAAQEAIDGSGFGGQVTWEHVNHDVLISILQRVKPVDETLRLVGKAVVEDMNFSRVCVGRIPVTEVAALMKNHGERLLERNIRRYLGLHGNRVNEGIRATLSSARPSDFYFFNNGLTLVCNDFSHNALQTSDYQVRVENLQIVNGGQTCMTILKTLTQMEKDGRELPKDASVLVRIYKLPRQDEDLVLQITHATNSQNPVDLRDLRANDERQMALEAGLDELGFTYRRKRMEGATRSTDITSGVAAEAVLAVWRNAPHQAKFLTREHFGKLYTRIFTPNLNAAQVAIAVQLYRIAENHRRRPKADAPEFVRYASCFIAMRMGWRLRQAMGIELDDLTHRNFDFAAQLVEEQGEAFFAESVEDVQLALTELYGEREISLQQLSATFRRGDLIERLEQWNWLG